MKLISKTIVTTLLGLGVLGVGLTERSSAAEFKMTASSSHPPIIPWVAAIKNHVVPESVKRAKALGHTIKWTEAYSGTLYNFKNTLEGIQDGLGDIGWVGTLWEPNKMPLENVSYFAPFVAVDTKNLQEISEDMHKKIPQMNKEWLKFNQVAIGVMSADGYVIVSKKPIRKLEDFKGLKLYAPGAVARWLEGTGAVGINAGLPIQYNGIKTGVADGSIVPGTAVLPFKLHEVAPYIIQANIGGSMPGALTMNLNTWKKLPKELQDMFMQLGKEYADLNTKEIKARRTKHLAIVAKQGGKIITMPRKEQERWAAAVPDIAGDWVKIYEKKGLPAKAVLDAYVKGAKARGEKPLRDWGVK